MNNKREFLEILRQALAGEVDQHIIDQNIKYYDDYISTHSNYDEEAIISELGDPRLLAKTIIDTQRIIKEKEKNNTSQGHTSENYYGEPKNQSNTEYDQQTGPRRDTIFFNRMSWYHKLILYTILFLVLFIILFVGRYIIKILFAFAVPVILMLFVFRLFRK